MGGGLVQRRRLGALRPDARRRRPSSTNGQQATDLPPGPEIEPSGTEDTFGPDATGPDESLDPLPSESPLETAGPDASPEPGAAASDGSGGGTRLAGSWSWVRSWVCGWCWAVSGVLWFRRFPGREPELAWRGVTSLATRFGVGPRPSQTPYEYTVSLSKVVPRVASDLRVVADAKVDASLLREPSDRGLGRAAAARPTGGPGPGCCGSSFRRRRP